jgi:hypothetical protein
VAVHKAAEFLSRKAQAEFAPEAALVAGVVAVFFEIKVEVLGAREPARVVDEIEIGGEKIGSEEAEGRLQ